jgi:hypothetical protein
MALFARRTKQYPPPATGQHDAVCVDVIDEGETDSTWGTRHQVRCVFEVDPTTVGLRDDGRRHLVSAWYTLSLAPSSNLTRDLTDWGVLAVDAESIDLEQLVDTPARLVLIHAEVRDGRTVARIKCILPAEPTHQLLASGEYERRGTDATATQPARARPTGTGDEDIPF